MRKVDGDTDTIGSTPSRYCVAKVFGYVVYRRIILKASMIGQEV